MKIAVINGPNLNFLGIREPHIYGYETLEDLEKSLQAYTGEKGDIDLLFFQSNHEGEIVDFMQACYHQGVEGIVMNPGALTHYSYALADAIKSVSIPTVEVHISNIYQREAFRQHSVTASNSIGVLSGFGFFGYQMGLDALRQHILTTKKEGK